MSARGGLRFARAACAAALVTAIMAAGPVVSTAVADIGVQDASYDPIGGSPTGSKPESKLWFNDGFWWSTMFDPPSGDNRIFRLASTGWVNTGVTIDARDNTRADVLSQGNTLYVSSHNFTSIASASTSSNGRLWRFTYNTATDTYTRDAAFPASGLPINAIKSETLVIDKDTTGRLWATWTDGSRVFVSSTNGTDTQWGTPFQVPGSTTLDADDISSLIAFDGKIGVMWSNQVDGRFWFAVHPDGSAPTAGWTAQALDGALTKSSDDHVNLKTFEGKVYAAVKTSETVASAPLTELLVRDTAGTWTVAPFGSVRNSHTRPIVVIDTSARKLRMFATGPQPPSTSGQSSGDILEKDADLASPLFPSDPASTTSVRGIGTPVISDTGSPDMNNVTSTKQNVSSTTGLMIMANNDITHRFWHNVLGAPVAGEPSPPPPPPPPPGGGTTLTFAPAADAQVKSTSPTNNYGSMATIRTHVPTVGGPPDYVSYLRFVVTGVTGTVQSVKLRLFTTDASPEGGSVFGVANTTWAESAITWNTRPAPGAQLAPGAPATLNTYREITLPAQSVPGNGTYSFMLQSNSTNSALYSSKEATSNKPELVVTTG
jgi:hypothetical protein